MKRMIAVPLAAALAGAAILGGCASPRPGVEVRTVEVLKPAPVACVKPEQMPAEPATIEAARGAGWQAGVTAAQAADLLAASALELRGALREALALLGGCRVPD